MADSREFVLIGSFTDNITPSLEKINNSLARLKSTFASLSSKRGGYGDITKTIGSLVSAQKHLADSVKEVKAAVSDSIPVLQQYKKELGGIASAHFAIARSAGQAAKNEAKVWSEAKKSAEDYKKFIDGIGSNRGTRTYRPGMMSGGGRSRPPGGGGGGGTGRVSPPIGGGGYSGGGGGGYRGGGGGMGAHMGEFGFAYTLGTSIAQPIQNAIITGFQIGVGFMTKPFEYFAGAFGERVKDQLDDLKAAGGFLSISKRSQNPFVSSMDDAIEFQQSINGTFAKMAAQLPGVTHDYVMVGKRLGDTIARVVDKDFEAARAEANLIRKTSEGQRFYGKEQITGGSQTDRQEVLETLLGDLTKKSTLAGIGGRSGVGGVSGAYGLPGLIERMVSQDEVSMGQFQRYASVFSDPAISDALSRNIDKINATNKDSVSRTKALSKLLDEVVTPELIEKLRTSVDGIYQGLRSAIFDPDTGLFGLGRQFKGIGKRLNGLGQYVDKFGKAVDDVSMAASTDLSIFEVVADIFVNTGQVLGPIIDNITLLFDPLKKVVDVLMDARHYTAEFARTFNQYREGLKALSEVKGNEFLKDTLDFRSSLLAINNLLLQVGAIGKGDFMNNADILMNAKNIDFGKMMSRMLDQLMNSTVAGDIGKMIGEIVGTVLTEVAKVTGFISGRIASSNKLFAGLKAGFDAAGGTKAFKNIFKDLFYAMLNVLGKLLQIIPLEALMLGGLALITPAVIQGLAMAFASRLWGGIQGLVNVVGSRMLASLKKQVEAFKNRRSGGPVKVVNVTDITGGQPLLSAGKGGALPGKGGELAKSGGPLAKAVSGITGFFTKLNNYFKGIGPRFMGFFKGIFGKLAIFGAVLTSVVSLFQGKDLATSLAEGAGPLLGAALGAALLPFLGPLGPLIGGWIGSMKPVVDTLTGYFKGIGYAINVAWQAIGPALDAIGGILQTIWNALVGIIPGMDQLASSFDFLNFAFIATKIAFYPFLRGLLDMAQGLQETKLALLYFDKWLNKTFQFGDRQGRLQAEIDKTDVEIATLKRTIDKLNADLLKPLPTPKPKPPGTPTATTPTKGVDAALRALGGDPNKKLNLPTVTPLSKPDKRVSGLTPPAADMAWYKSQMAGGKGAGGTTTIPKDLQKAGQTPAAVKAGTDKTTTAVKELTAKITSQSSLQTSVAAIYNLLASGMLSVRTNMAGMMMPGALPGRLPGTGIPVIPPSVIPRGGLIGGADYRKFGTGSVNTNGMGGGSGSGGGGGDKISINSPVNIYPQRGQSADEIASLVAVKIGEAVADARASSIFV